MLLKSFLPREHGLTVVWITTFLLSFLVSRYHSYFGIFTFLILTASLLAYDPILSALRLWSAGKDIKAYLIKSYPFTLVLPLVIFFWFVFGILFENFPPASLLIFIAIAVCFFLSFYSGEKRLSTLILSISTVTSFLLLIVSAFDLSLGPAEIDLFVAFTACEVFVATGPHEIIQARVRRNDYNRSYLFRIVPAYLITLFVVSFVLVHVSIVPILLLLLLLTVILTSYLFMRDLQIRKIGLVLAFFNLIMLISFASIYFTSV
jgi:hypothetical protein